ncbi:MAG: hypothetical protein ABIJ97_16940 [Bacteroidota bacterium]
MKTGIITKAILLIGMLFLVLNIQKSIACEIEFEIDGEKKEQYKVGDEVVIKVKITFTHRVCTVGIKQTKFESKGVKILTATDWKETSPGVWERKLKIKIEEPKKGKVELSATRTCDKEGGFNSIVLNAKKK